MDHMRAAGNRTSSVILNQTKYMYCNKNIEMGCLNNAKQVEAERGDVISPQKQFESI